MIVQIVDILQRTPLLGILITYIERYGSKNYIRLNPGDLTRLLTLAPAMQFKLSTFKTVMNPQELLKYLDDFLKKRFAFNMVG